MSQIFRPLSLVVAAAFCISGATVGYAQSTTEPFKVGLLASMTGPLAFTGDPTSRGVKVAINQINSAGGVNGRKIDLISYDTEGNPDKTLVFMKKLINDDKVAVIIGPDLSATVRAALPAAEEAGVPVIFNTPIIEPKPGSFSFTAFPSEETSYRVSLTALKSRGIKKLAVLATTDFTGESGLKWLKTLGSEYGISITAEERLDAQDKDVAPQLTNIRKASPDGIFYVGSGTTVAVICKTYTQLGLTQPLVISTGAVSSTFPQLLKGITPDTLIFPTYKMMVMDSLPASDPNKKTMDALTKLYEPANGKKPDFYAGDGWDDGQIVIMALRQAGDDRTKIRDAIQQIRNYEGALATLNFSPENHRGGGADGQIMVQFKGDKFIPLTQ